MINCMNNVINKVSQLESAQNDLRADVTKIEQTVTYMSDTIDAMDDNKTDVRRTELIERDISAMKERMIDLSNRARRNNLVLYNINFFFQFSFIFRHTYTLAMHNTEVQSKKRWHKNESSVS